MNIGRMATIEEMPQDCKVHFHENIPALGTVSIEDWPFGPVIMVNGMVVYEGKIDMGAAPVRTTT